jgi:signal transduction histidine kinase
MAPGVYSPFESGRRFEPFYRLDGSRNRANSSSGFGLAIVRMIVEGHGGEISASRSTLGGASFVDTFPRE